MQNTMCCNIKITLREILFSESLFCECEVAKRHEFSWCFGLLVPEGSKNHCDICDTCQEATFVHCTVSPNDFLKFFAIFVSKKGKSSIRRVRSINVYLPITQFWYNFLFENFSPSIHSKFGGGKMALFFNKPRMARVIAAGMAQNTYRTALILMFEKVYFSIFFGVKNSKTKLMLGFELTTCRFVSLYRGVIKWRIVEGRPKEKFRKHSIIHHSNFH